MIAPCYSRTTIGKIHATAVIEITEQPRESDVRFVGEYRTFMPIVASCTHGNERHRASTSIRYIVHTNSR